MIITDDTDIKRDVVNKTGVSVNGVAMGGYENTYNIFVDGVLVCMMTVKAKSSHEKRSIFYTMTETDRVKNQSNEEWLEEYSSGEKKQRVFSSLRELLERLGYTVNRETIK